MENGSSRPVFSHSESQRLHRKQTGWQILLPIILVSLIAVGLIVFLIIVSLRPGGAVTHMVWADISTIWILMPVIVLSIIPAALVAALIVGMSKLIKGVPHYGVLGQYYAERMAEKVKAIADKAAQPAIKVGGWNAGWKRLRNLLRVG